MDCKRCIDCKQEEIMRSKLTWKCLENIHSTLPLNIAENKSLIRAFTKTGGLEI